MCTDLALVHLLMRTKALKNESCTIICIVYNVILAQKAMNDIAQIFTAHNFLTKANFEARNYYILLAKHSLQQRNCPVYSQ